MNRAQENFKKVFFRPIVKVWPHQHEYHVLTYAEEGFAPLSRYGEVRGLVKNQVVAFADEVNERNAVGTLFPEVGISAIPRACIRELRSSLLVSSFMAKFLELNRTTIQARRLLFDFRTPVVSAHVRVAAGSALRKADLSEVELVVIVE